MRQCNTEEVYCQATGDNKIFTCINAPYYGFGRGGISPNTKKNVELVTFINCQQTNIPEAGLDFPSAKILSISCGVQTVHEDAFKNVNSVRELDLGNNLISTLPNGVFKRLENLKKLTLSNNNLEELPRNIFDGLRNLERVHLSYNSISKIDTKAFDSTRRVKEVYLNNNNINVIPSGFGKLSSLRTVDLSYNKIQVLEKMSLSSLEKLNLSHNAIKDLPVQLFRFTSLKILDLSYNQLSIIHEDVLKWHELKELYLQNNQISVFEVTGIGLNQIALNLLDVRHNRLVFIEEDFVKRATNLNTFKVEDNPWDCNCLEKMELLHGNLLLDFSFAYVNGEEALCVIVPNVSNNNVCNINKTDLVYYYIAFKSQIEPRGFLLNSEAGRWCKPSKDHKNYTCGGWSFYGFKYYISKTNVQHLVRMTILDCKEINLPEDTIEYTGIKYLTISSCDIETINENAFRNLNNLQELDLGNNSISKINESIFKWSEELKKLNLSNNNIEELSRNTFEGLHNLKQLYLSKNAISKFDIKTLDPAKNLEEMYLDNNQITVIPSRVFSKLTDLRVADLSHNYIASVDNLFSSTFKLTFLNLSHNALVELPEQAFQFINLEILDVSFNKLNVLYEQSLNLGTLKEFYLQNNQLTGLEVRAMGFNRIPLSVLDLRHNKLVFLHEDFIKVAKNLLTFKVEGNLWDCDCYDRIVLLRGDLSVDLSSPYVNGEEPVCIAGISNSDNPCNIDQSNLSYYYKALEEDE
ncbi:hypothetical protein ILUMI_27042 [Ignelater luminosus]|uniref:Chaoptin n=1 Tax=Ignelater luminosus TaxID=2038154 RepID=A0A8K0FVS6_IGNLU|nr:hypothetical protein ILUMI_27042 [Ignelater luminosus]